MERCCAKRHMPKCVLRSSMWRGQRQMCSSSLIVEFLHFLVEKMVKNRPFCVALISPPTHSWANWHIPKDSSDLLVCHPLTINHLPQTTSGHRHQTHPPLPTTKNCIFFFVLTTFIYFKSRMGQLAHTKSLIIVYFVYSSQLGQYDFNNFRVFEF